MSQVIQTQEAPVSERPTQDNITAPSIDPQELAALEAIRKGLCCSGIDHDDWDFIAGKILDGLKDAEVLRLTPSVTEVIRSTEPDAVVYTEYHIHQVGIGSGRLTEEQARRIGVALHLKFGGTLERRFYEATAEVAYAFGNYRVAVNDNLVINLYFDPYREEA